MKYVLLPLLLCYVQLTLWVKAGCLGWAGLVCRALGGVAYPPHAAPALAFLPPPHTSTTALQSAHPVTYKYCKQGSKAAPQAGICYGKVMEEVFLYCHCKALWSVLSYMVIGTWCDSRKQFPRFSMLTRIFHSVFLRPPTNLIFSA